MNTEYKISKRRNSELERELEFLRTVRSREVAAMIAEAMTYGDLENNSEYDAAKSVQQKLQGRIAEIEQILSCAIIIETEEKRLSEEFLAELKKALQSCGLSTKQSDSYAEYCRDEFEEQGREQYGMLPNDKCLETLKEAQKIISGRSGSFELNEDTIDRFLRIPCDQWKSAKTAIMECFACSEEAVDTLFNEDEELLFISEDSVFALADYLKATLSDENMAWKIFRKAAPLGVEPTKSRIVSVLDMLGEEFGQKVIRADAEANEWLFWRYYSDPVGCIAYMKGCGLTAEKILTVIQQEPNILYMYKENRKVSYGHDQEYIDEIIRRYR